MGVLRTFNGHLTQWLAWAVATHIQLNNIVRKRNELKLCIYMRVIEYILCRMNDAIEVSLARIASAQHLRSNECR